MLNITISPQFKVILLSIAASIFFICYAFGITQPQMRVIQKKVQKQTMTIERAVTNQEQSQGLSDRKNMEKNQAMLFVYHRPQPMYFWMKRMHFPLDIIWLDKDCRIIDISVNQQPCESEKVCPIISPHPNENAQYVLEVKGGFAASENIVIGQQLDVCS